MLRRDNSLILSGKLHDGLIDGKISNGTRFNNGKVDYQEIVSKVPNINEQYKMENQRNTTNGKLIFEFQKNVCLEKLRIIILTDSHMKRIITI